ncbi:hypothetical protein ACIGKR_32710 [Rhodococcus qingshengii]|uniref:hypothetical protein n=1 Tax=Rhodococcus qingshengii TaxID=334542 RepID=UPI0037C4FC2E
MRSRVDTVGERRGMWIVAALSILALAALICAVVTFSIAVQSISGGMGPAVEARVLDVEDGATLGRCVHPRTYTVGWAQDEVDHIESFVECSSAHGYAVGQTVRLWRGSSGHLVGSSPTLIVALSSSLSLVTGALAVFSGRKAVRAWPARRKGRSDVGTSFM